MESPEVSARRRDRARRLSEPPSDAPIARDEREPIKGRKTAVSWQPVDMAGHRREHRVLRALDESIDHSGARSAETRPLDEIVRPSREHRLEVIDQSHAGALTA